MTYQVNTVKFHATIVDKKNREGLQRPEDWKFGEIYDLDQICEQVGGTQLHVVRKPFAPFTEGRFGDEAMTLYRVGNSLVLNESSGYHPDQQTTVFTFAKEADTEVVPRFQKYYMSKGSASKEDVDFIAKLRGMDELDILALKLTYQLHL